MLWIVQKKQRLLFEQYIKREIDIEILKQDL